MDPGSGHTAYQSSYPQFFQGKIYQGKAKTVCVPGLNCYSCPAATGACPIGAFQAVVGSSKFKFSYYITGFLILLGVTLGRFICGFCVRLDGFRICFTKSPERNSLRPDWSRCGIWNISSLLFLWFFCRCLQRIRSGWEIRSSANIFVRRAFWRGRSRFPSEMSQSGLHWASCFRLNSVFWLRLSCSASCFTDPSANGSVLLGQSIPYLIR